MHFEGEQTIKAPIEEVWAYFMDPNKVAQCAPGFKSMEILGPDHFKPTLNRAGLPDMRVYDLRHSCASILLAAGENVKVISERLGHASIALTLDVYSHIQEGQQAQASAKLERLFGTG